MAECVDQEVLQAKQQQQQQQGGQSVQQDGHGRNTQCNGPLQESQGQVQQQDHKHPQKQQWEQSQEVLEVKHGPIIRVVQPGESFGELALLQRGGTRTATLLAEPMLPAKPSPATDSSGIPCCSQRNEQQQQQGTRADAGEDDKQQKQQWESTRAAVAVTAADGGDSCSTQQLPLETGVCLIRITRPAFDAAVRSVQVSALEGLLGFLGAVPAFAGLCRDQLTSLAVFCRPMKAAAGQVLAGQGELVQALMVVQASAV
jgi:hypothetical protein